MPSTRPRLLIPALGLNVLIASGTFLVAKSALHEMPPLPLALFRFVLASAAVWVLARAVHPHERIAREDRGRIVLLGVLAVPLNQGLFLYGLQWSSASHAALLYALTPACVTMFTAVAHRARPSPRALGGIALAFLGVLTLLLQRGLHFDRHSVLGDVLILLAVGSWSLYLAAGREVSRRYGPLVVTAEALLAGTLVFLPIGLLGLRGFHPAAVSTGGWMGLLYLAFLTSGVNYVIWFWGLQHLRSSTVALLTNLQPLVTAAMAWALLHEALPAGFALSCALVLGGVWITQRAPATARAPITTAPA